MFFFFKGLFPPGQGATIGVDFMIKTVEIDGEKIKVLNIYKSYCRLFPSLYQAFSHYIMLPMQTNSRGRVHFWCGSCCCNFVYKLYRIL